MGAEFRCGKLAEVPFRSSLCLMVQMVRDRAISPVELVEAHLRQIDARNTAVNAFVKVFAERARAEAREREAAIGRGEALGLLHGVPLTVKDSFDIAGQPTAAGSRFREGHRAANDAAAVARLRAEGAILLGRTNTPEMLASYETDNFVTGRTDNPWDPDRTPGGSSGGEAAVIAAFCSPGGIASDGGGSIRVPAHFCGIAGLKPTPGRIPATGHYPALGYPGGLTTVVGPMARSARDLRLLFAALVSFDAQDPFSVPVPLAAPWKPYERPYASALFSAPAPLAAPMPADASVPLAALASRPARIGVWERFYHVPVHEAVRAAVRKAAGMLAGLGLAVDDFQPAGLERAPNVWGFLFAQWPHVATRKMFEGREEELHWTLRESLTKDQPTAEQVLLNLAARDSMRASLLRQMDDISAILMPVCGVPAFAHRQRKWEIDGKSVGLFQAMMPAVLANVLGLPAVTIPVTLSEEGLPVGVQLVGRPYEDELLLDLAVRLEEARGPWTGL